MNPDKYNSMVIAASLNGNKFHPMPFSTEMVRAILENRKTQTRRVIKPQPDDIDYSTIEGFHTAPSKNPEVVIARFEETGEDKELNLRYRRGDVLWVRETFMDNPNKDIVPVDFRYKASESEQYISEWRGAWKSGRFMPRVAARIFLQVENVWVEKLQDISREDIEAEGAIQGTDNYGTMHDVFRKLWDGINAKRGYGWDANPLVKVIKFRRLKSGFTFQREISKYHSV